MKSVCDFDIEDYIGDLPSKCDQLHHDCSILKLFNVMIITKIKNKNRQMR